ncbi:uncharacterized protein LOC110029340 [Phalaenopsis equestris]|uniref:uncharacterized protein LOC110029340 n=1 Tax=Phalaenopsis equestris TaxID=78828 RepID=UPI0009E31835|nr:uncharacterized protein LOC110029340 [Phalaenopsis equestris]
MVISAENVPESPPEPLTPSISSTPPSRLRNASMSGLHNIDIPFNMTWGRHQFLRCLNINRRGEIITHNRKSNLIETSANLPEQVRLDETQVRISDAVVMTDTTNQSEPNHQSDDLRERDHIPPSISPLSVTRRTRRVPILKIPCCNVSPPPPTPAAAPLRKSTGKRSVRLLYDNASPPPPPPPLLRKCARKRSVRLMSDNLEKLEKPEHCPKISISLSRKEIEEDFYTLTGLPPCRRAKKRPRAIKKQLDQLLPGSLLPSITPSKYDVPD